MGKTPRVGRFAPTPNNYLHIGNFASALFARKIADITDGLLLLRFDDCDAARAKPEFKEACLKDCADLGIKFDSPPFYQSDRLPLYDAAQARLARMDILYACFCSRKDASLAGAPPLSCVNECKSLPLSIAEKSEKAKSLKINLEKALPLLKSPIEFADNLQGLQKPPQSFFEKDPIIRRMDGAPSYALSCGFDDSDLQISLCVRGEDLLLETFPQILIARLLDAPSPRYAHHPNLTNEKGEKFSKSVNPSKKPPLPARENIEKMISRWDARKAARIFGQ